MIRAKASYEGGGKYNTQETGLTKAAFSWKSVIVGFTSATSEYDFICFASEQPSNLHSGFVDRLSRRAASPVPARRIPVRLFEHHPHRIDDLGCNGSTGIEIQVNTSIRSRHGSYTLSAITVGNAGPVDPK
jgi:hypothetical protein